MRQPIPSVVNDFSKGLITETTEISFPQNACTETFDCVFDRTGFVARRKAFVYEDNHTTDLTFTHNTGRAYTEFIWTAVGGNGDISFLVQQHGSVIHFYDISSSTDVSPNRKAFTIVLTSYQPTGDVRDPGIYPCQYASGRGQLTIVSQAIKSLYVIYTSSTGSLTVTSYDLQTRDFAGLNDGLAVTTRPTDSVSGLQTDNPAHYYNLINQGWGEVAGAALTAWDTARSDMPSNADYIALYRASVTNIFDNNRVLAMDPLNTPAAKGHFILTATNPNRTAALLADGFSLTLSSPASLISQSTGSLLYFGWVNGAGSPNTPTFAFDGIKSVAYGSTPIKYIQGSLSNLNTMYIGKNYSTAPQIIQKAVVYGTTDRGYQATTNPASITYTLYAKQTAPASKTDGTVLGTVTFADLSDGSGGKTINSNDTTTAWKYVWVGQNQISSLADTPLLAEVEFYTPGSGSSGIIDNISTFERPKTCSFFAGRLFYAGLDDFQLNNTIFFTQILQSESQYGQCYQVNDPTNESIFNLLPSDGGTIVIPEMASVRKLFAYQNALLILASNGVWMVTGGSSGGFGGGFQANDYFVKKLSSIGTASPLSIVDRRGVPVWWSEDGIYTIQYDPRFNSFEVINMTFKTIRSFFLDIPKTNRKYVKGAYDPVLDIIYWVYNSNANPVDNWSYDSVLVYSGINQAFYPWTIGGTNPTVRGVVAVQDAQHIDSLVIKYPVTSLSGSTDTLTYATHLGTGYLDWTATDYLSYFITSFKIDGKIQQYFQSNYIWVMEEQQQGASCYVQGLFDFFTDPNSGKWSNRQQVCNSFRSDRAVNFKRLKIRGKGRALQLRFTSETGKPFQIQGWAIYETLNQQP
jgi:hypothetical protein